MGEHVLHMLTKEHGACRHLVDEPRLPNSSRRVLTFMFA